MNVPLAGLNIPQLLSALGRLYPQPKGTAYQLFITSQCPSTCCHHVKTQGMEDSKRWTWGLVRSFHPHTSMASMPSSGCNECCKGQRHLTGASLLNQLAAGETRTFCRDILPGCLLVNGVWWLEIDLLYYFAWLFPDVTQCVASWWLA